MAAAKNIIAEVKGKAQAKEGQLLPAGSRYGWGGFRPGAGRKLMFETPEDMERVVMEYFTYCVDEDVPPTMAGLAKALGFKSRRSLFDYRGRDDFNHVIEYAKLCIEQHRVEALVSGRDCNVAGAIFDLKNNFGYADKQEIQHGGGDGLLGRILKQIDGQSNGLPDPIPDE